MLYHWQRWTNWHWVTVHLDGRTNLTTNYAHREDRAATVKQYGGKMFSPRRSRRRFYSVGRVHTLLAKRERAYFVTHTMAPEWSNDDRRKAFRRFLDRLRKEPGYCGHQWVTEMHPGETMQGLIHHHVFVRFTSAWMYRDRVQNWSKSYCGSSNGLDIQAVRTQHVGGYMGKALGYMAKALDTDKLPFRWWGTSRVARSVTMRGRDVPVGVKPEWYKGEAVRHTANQCAYAPPHIALAACARLTSANEQRRRHRLRLRHTFKLNQNKKDEHLRPVLAPEPRPDGVHCR